MRIIIDINRITLDDMITLEEGNAGTRFLRGFLARFIVDEQTNKYLSEKEALIEAGKIPLGQMREITATIIEQMQNGKNEIIPPFSGEA